MLKISQSHSMPPTVTLTLEGRVVGPWVTELKNTCDQYLHEKRQVHLDFTDVSFADRDGIALLVELRARGVSFQNCSPFLEEELRSPLPRS